MQLPLRYTLPLAPLLLAACRAVPPPEPVGPLPSAAQLRWHERVFYAFVHFNMNTFTDVEWGEGRESPDAFQPSALDCRQWARVCKSAGMDGIILTAKHHDGFCLWPSATTEHTVARSAWRGGQGDVLRELAEACREAGLGFGVYLSPWDRSHPAYGDSPRYNEVFKGQLREVLSGYGEVFEVWFDGACGEGPNGKRQVYDWPGFVAVVRDLQPEAVIFSDAGPDVRWVGNERGYAGETCWALLCRDELEPGTPRFAELTEGHADGTHWVPAECDVSIRPGWYYHAAEDGQVKSLRELEDIWYGSVGRNANLLLNLPVDRRGLVHEHDAARLSELGELLRATFAVDLARGAPAGATNERGGARRFAAAGAVDGDPATYWACDDDVRAASLEVELDAPAAFDRLLLREHVALGQRVRAFDVEVHEDGAWRTLARGTTIGARRILVFPPVRARRLRLNVRDARACPTLAELGLYASPACAPDER